MKGTELTYFQYPSRRLLGQRHWATQHAPTSQMLAFLSLHPPMNSLHKIFSFSVRNLREKDKTAKLLKIAMLSQKKKRDLMNIAVFSTSPESFCFYSFTCSYASPLTPTDQALFTGHLRLLISLILQFRCLRQAIKTKIGCLHLLQCFPWSTFHIVTATFLQQVS